MAAESNVGEKPTTRFYIKNYNLKKNTMDNRAIKFRAFDGNKMHYHTWLDDQDEVHNLWQFVVALQGGCKLQQFIGLLDRNDKEIYEGDILETETGKPMPVEWNKTFASFCLYREDWAFAHWFGESCNSQQCTIIGNIHENPELIN